MLRKGCAEPRLKIRDISPSTETVRSLLIPSLTDSHNTGAEYQSNTAE